MLRLSGQSAAHWASERVCVSRTDQAATRLVEDPDFARQVKAACRKVLPQAAAKTQRRKIGSKATSSAAAPEVGSGPKVREHLKSWG